MPSVSKKQHNLMAAVAHNKAFAKKVGIPQSVGKDFTEADKGKSFKQGGINMKKRSTNPRMAADLGRAMRLQQASAPMNRMAAPTAMPAMPGMKRGGKSDAKEDTKMDMAQDKAMIKKAMKQHDAQEHKGGKGTKLSLCKGGKTMKYATGGRLSSKGEHPIQKQSKRGATPVKMARGGNLRSKRKII